MFRKTAMATLAVCVLSGVALAQGGASISGQWEGAWTNSHGSQGDDWLTVREGPYGRIQGDWGGFDIQGERTSDGRYVWRGYNSKGRSYEAIARVGRGGRSLRIDYEVTYRRNGELRSYAGQSRLRRVGY